MTPTRYPPGYVRWACRECGYDYPPSQDPAPYAGVCQVCGGALVDGGYKPPPAKKPKTPKAKKDDTTPNLIGVQQI